MRREVFAARAGEAGEGVAQGSISELEAGTTGRRPGVAVLQRLAKALGVSVTALVE